MEESAESVERLRTEYVRDALDEHQVDPDPLRQFTKWFHEAIAAGVREPDAMTVATATRDGRPSARTISLRGHDERGFVFYSNYESRKAEELEANPFAAIVFHWRELERQVRAAGPVRRVSPAESAAYFATRPFGSRLGAWASPQSSPLANRAELDSLVGEAAARFANGDVPLPPFWGGYLLEPVEVEVWQGRASRLHDRVQYTRRGDGSWRIARLAP